MNIRKVQSTLLLLFTMLLSTVTGCSSGSEGFGAHAEKGNNLPVGVPKSIVLAPFSGDARITKISMDLIADQMHNLGFEVVPWSSMDKYEAMTNFPSYDNIDEPLRKMISTNLGVDGIMIGKATSASEMFKSRSYLDLNVPRQN